MDHDRIKEAHKVFMRNLRKALRASGIEPKTGSMQIPPSDANLFEGVDATPDELVVWSRWRAYDAQRTSSALERTASIGMAVEMGMHEVNSEFSHTIYALKDIYDRTEPDSHVHKKADDALASVRRLSNLTSVTSRFNQSRFGGHSNFITGKHILDRSATMFERWIEQEKIKITASPDFLKATMYGNEAVILPVFLNLIRNAMYWSSKGSQLPCIDLDAKEVSYLYTYQDENDVVQTDTRTTWIFSVADNGPGIPESERENIFRPFLSGRASSGIGLYLARRNMERNENTVVLSSESHPLGGAFFLIGSRRVLDPVPESPLSEREQLLMAAVGIVQMIADGQTDDVLREHADTWSEIGREALRVRIQGLTDICDSRLAEAFSLANALLDQRITAKDLPEWVFNDQKPTNLGNNA